MTYAKRAGWGIAATLLLAGGAACSSMQDAEAFSRGPDDDRNGREPGAENVDNAPGTGDPGAPAATGVVLVHSAAFPAFRLCFENSLNLRPLPDSKAMPQANVVGAEIGSLVRLAPLDAPGKVFVIRESAVRASAGDPSGPSCEELLGDGASALLSSDYHVANVAGSPEGITQPLGKDRVQVLAITGCGSQVFTSFLKVDSASCGADWSPTTGNLVANVIDLPTTATGATDSTIPVQLVHLAPSLEAQLGTAKLEVSFGELATPGKLPTEVASETALLKSSEQVALPVDQNADATYGTHGFRIVAREGNGSAKFSLDQSLAAVQSSSAPREVPKTYYRVASNYALLLLGDPSVPATLDGGAPNTDRRRVQLLAVPVLDPATRDAGAGAGDEDGGG
ncbi:MAG: hypothetical protein KF795_25600 [Labilithrix sp.]|nr:hypothetical protein [Labilithrix sp.]